MSRYSGHTFAERYGGFVISAAFHVAFLVTLQNFRVPVDPAPAKPEPEPIRIELSPIQETAALEMPVMPPLLDWEENVATVADNGSAESTPATAGSLPEVSQERQVAALAPSALPLNLDAVRYEPEPEPDPLTEPDLLIQDDAPEPDAEADSPQNEEETPLILDERIQAYLRDREKRLNEYNNAVGQKGSDLVAQKLSLARADLEGKRWLETTEGGQEGAIRSFTSSGVNPKVAEEVYSRYGIQAFNQFVDIKDANGYNYLNSARVGNEQYVKREGRGMFRVLSIPQSAYAHLARLERDALIQGGHDPAATRILEVEFGIASVGTQYDLVVTRLKVAPMEFRP